MDDYILLYCVTAMTNKESIIANGIISKGIKLFDDPNEAIIDFQMLNGEDEKMLILEIHYSDYNLISNDGHYITDDVIDEFIIFEENIN